MNNVEIISKTVSHLMQGELASGEGTFNRFVCNTLFWYFAPRFDLSAERRLVALDYLQQFQPRQNAFKLQIQGAQKTPL